MDCPPWWEDHDEHEAPACFADMHAALDAACRAAVTAIPNRGNIAELHRLAFRRLVPLHYYAGGFRQEDPKRLCLGQNVGIKGQNGAPDVSGFPFEHVLGAMHDLCKWVEREFTLLELQWLSMASDARARQLSGIIGVAIGQYVAIHPFLNGNGRTSRMLWAILLARSGLPPTFSIVKRPGPPYGDVMRAAMLGDYGPAVKVVFEAIEKGPSPTFGLPIATA